MEETNPLRFTKEDQPKPINSIPLSFFIRRSFKKRNKNDWIQLSFNILFPIARERSIKL